MPGTLNHDQRHRAAHTGYAVDTVRRAFAVLEPVYGPSESVRAIALRYGIAEAKVIDVLCAS